MKILVLLSRVPYPLEKGDKLRAFHQIKSLSHEHQIVLCCLSDKKIHPKAIEVLKPYCLEVKIIRLRKIQLVFSLLLGLFSGRPFQVSYFYHYHAKRSIEKLIEKHLPKHIYCQLVRVSEYVKKYTIIPKTLDYMDALSMGIERRIPTAPFYMKFLLRTEANRLRNYEKAIFPFFQKHLIISDQDRQLIKHPENEKISIVPNGVDFDFFHPDKLSKATMKKEYDLVFTGNMNYPPNVDSACFIAGELLPMLRKTFPGIRLLISGAAPSIRVRRLQNRYISVTGWMEDIRLAYAQSRIFIAPMQIGTGLQNKLLEAMAMKIPCITSELANNALGAIPGEQILIGRNKEEYVQHIVHLLEDKEWSRTIAENGFQFVRDNFNWNKSAVDLEKLIREGP